MGERASNGLTQCQHVSHERPSMSEGWTASHEAIGSVAARLWAAAVGRGRYARMAWPNGEYTSASAPTFGVLCSRLPKRKGFRP